MQSANPGDLPQRFGKYTLVRRLAAGGMAEIFLGIQRSMAGFEKLIVIKRILPHLAKDQDFVEMLFSEARIAATLNHPNVAHVYDVGFEDGHYYIAMEHIHGEDLRSIVRQMKRKDVVAFPLEHALAIVSGCCAGLSYAHEKPDLAGEPQHIVHRDVSPQNILVTFSGDVKLVDFGIAKAGRSAMEDTKSGKLKGKVPYMSPEQAQGDPLDARSDVFSLGVILFELCTGRRLFKGASEFDTMKLIVEGDYPRPRSLQPGLPPRLEEIIVTALGKDRNERYQSARELLVDLDDFVRKERLAVSSVSLGEWMRLLFDDQLEEQRTILREGRRLAEDMAERDPLATGATQPVTLYRSRRVALIGGAALLAALVAGLWVALAPPTAEHVGAIDVQSEPPGAAIWIDGDRRAETTPAHLGDLPVGSRYVVKLSAEGFSAHTEHVGLSTEHPSATVRAQLAPIVRPGSLSLSSTPSGARVLLDGADTGQRTPVTLPIPTPMQHTVTLTLDGYESWSSTVGMGPGQAEQFSAVLERPALGPDEALLRVVIDPPEARLQVDGEWHESGSPYELRLEARRYRIKASADAHRSVERRLNLPGGERTDLSLELARRQGGSATPAPPALSGLETPTEAPADDLTPGRLTFDARPWCQVAIDGRTLGQTPIVHQPLSPGTHRLTCTNPELGVTRNVTVTIRSGETTRQRVSLL